MDVGLVVTVASGSHATEVRFWDRVGRASTPDGCWLWTGSLNRGGRGRFTAGGVTDYAYRWALVFSGIEIPGGQPVRHLCGNPACCRPDHLSIEGGQRANNQDTLRHGRHRSAKLSGPAVRQMRERQARDRRPLGELALEHGVTESTVSAALTGASWSHIGGPLARSRKSARRDPADDQ